MIDTYNLDINIATKEQLQEIDKAIALEVGE